MIPPYIETEVRQWPGAVIVGFEQGRKHRKLTLRFGEAERFVTMSSTASDRRAKHRQLTDVRRALGNIGAVRTARAKAASHRCRNRPDRPVLAHVPPAPVKANPFEVLAGISFPQPPRLSWWRRLLAWFA